ncbi:MAG: CvfB family protein [Leadbetterella sp.]
MNVGQINKLKILRGTSVGMYLSDEEGNDVLLPHKYIPDDAVVGKEIDVFIYRDSEDRLIATNLDPLIKVGEFAVLEVVATSKFGAFLDWGLEKDLFVPFKEQNHKLQEGQYVPVYMYLDEQTDRLVASAKVNKYFKNLENIDLEEGQKVSGLVFEKTDLGYNIVINHAYKGLLYQNEIFKSFAWGDTIEAYVKKIREDGKIDLSLTPLRLVENLEKDALFIIEKLKANEGKLMLTDSSDPLEIMDHLQMSKKAFKRALGTLYKTQKVKINENDIELIS